MDTTIFETHYENYCRQIAELNLPSLKSVLGVEIQGQKAIIPFFGEEYMVSHRGIGDQFGTRPDYMVCVILSKYLLLCPHAPVVSKEWSTLKDFHKMSRFTNLSVFTSDAERPIVNKFSGRIGALEDTSQKLGGKPCKLGISYDFAMEFIALPRIKLLLLFNDRDEEFPATCSILFQRHAEDYLDPESLIMIGIFLTRQLIKLSI